MQKHAVESADKIRKELEEATKKITAILDKGAADHPDLIAVDHIRDTITELFAGRVGKRLDQNRLDDIYKDGVRRYEQKTPPGYMDAKKDGVRKFGDLVVWNEVLEYARNVKNPIILVTSDKKEDWWWEHGQFTIGPRPELVQEMMDVSKVRFYMYNLDRFLDEAPQYIDTKVASTEVKKAAEEFKEIQVSRDARSAVGKADSVQGFIRDMVGQLFDRERADPSEVQARLTAMPATQYGKVTVNDYVDGAEALLQRPLTTSELSMFIEALGSGKDGIFLAASKTCWDVVKTVTAYSIVAAEMKNSQRPADNK